VNWRIATLRPVPERCRMGHHGTTSDELDAIGLLPLLVLATLLLQPIAGMVSTEFMTTSNLWLTPVQGLVSGAFDVFFVSRGLEPRS
jgi:hypothetical protein